MRIIYISALAALSLMVAPSARAAQDTTVEKDNAPVRQEPADKGKIIDYMQAGDELRVSSFPVNGSFYKVRARNGQYGWINAKHLSLKPAAEEEESSDKGGPEPERDRRFFVRALGGLDLFKPGDLNDVFAFSELNGGWMAGGELGWRFSNRFTVILRQEVLLKDVVAREVSTQIVYNLGVRSYPLMAGLDFTFIKDFPVQISVGIFAGLAINTSFAAEALSIPPPNRTIIRSNPFTTMVRVGVARPLGRMFSLYGEVGYRHLKTEALGTENGNGGGNVFKIAGEWKPRVIDLSGITLAAGFGFHF